jgi:hypothetical protein
MQVMPVRNSDRFFRVIREIRGRLFHAIGGAFVRQRSSLSELEVPPKTPLHESPFFCRMKFHFECPCGGHL